MRNGILVGGNWIIDQVKVIDAFPEEEKLVNILKEYSSNGGSAYNVLKGLARLNANFPLSGVGLVGDDDRGAQIIADCRDLGIDATQILKIPGAHTAYTDVMTVKSTGKRTFFHQRGANALLDIPHFNFHKANEKIFHLGYLLLLDNLDLIHEDGNTGAAEVLKSATEHGLITSADLVSEQSDRFAEVVMPSLPYIDYLFLNEFEAGMITGIKTASAQAEPLLDKCYEAAAKIIDMGVRRWVILHFPAGVVAVDRNLRKIYQPRVKLPAEKVLGAVGAGDAFAAGVLIGVHSDWDMEASLELGVCAAASSLFSATSSGGIVPAEDCLRLSRLYGFR